MEDRNHKENSVKTQNIFCTCIGFKSLNLSNLKIIGKGFEKSFESGVNTTLRNQTLFDESSMNYLNVEITSILAELLKPFCKTFVFNISNIWINRYDEKDYQGAHVHPSDFSFIIYYKSDKSHTVFNSPFSKLLEISNNKLHDRIYEPSLNNGDMIIFPSYLEHWVRPNSKNTTIAGNIDIVDLKK
jgi:hypothetical protein|tara:strand:+ start:200 stop:757 length:558 start_codon:yes stop_codon:yes gene_type:complete